MTNRDKLTQAAALIQEVMATLDTGTRVCPCCTVTHYSNWEHFRSHTQLASMTEKLKRIGNSDAMAAAPRT
jgi:hypothetical protein